MAVMAKWRNKTFEVSKKKVNPLKNFSTSTTIKGDDSKSKKKKTELVPFTFDIDVHANAGVTLRKSTSRGALSLKAPECYICTAVALAEKPD